MRRSGLPFTAHILIRRRWPLPRRRNRRSPSVSTARARWLWYQGAPERAGRVCERPRVIGCALWALKAFCFAGYRAASDSAVKRPDRFCAIRSRFRFEPAHGRERHVWANWLSKLSDVCLRSRASRGTYPSCRSPTRHPSRNEAPNRRSAPDFRFSSPDQPVTFRAAR